MWYDPKGRHDHHVLREGKEYTFYNDGVVQHEKWNQRMQGFVAARGRLFAIEDVTAIWLTMGEFLRTVKWGTDRKTTEKYLDEC